MLTYELLANAIVAGILLGGFYAAISLGISLAFGLLDIVNIAHPVFVILGGYIVYTLNTKAGMDPILAGLLFTPVFYLLGLGVYYAYYNFFEKRGQESLRGLVFFFGILFLIEVGLLLTYGVDYRLVHAAYIGETFTIGVVGLAYRMLLPFVLGLLVTLALYFFLSRTFLGRVIMAVSQDSWAVRLMGANPTRIKSVAFGLGIATASFAGSLLIIIGPIEPSLGREYIGRVFAVVVLGGMGSISGTMIAAVILGIAESLTSTFYGPAWAVAVSFAILLGVLAIRPSGLFGR
jgi:branched-chain amino acid transport system permease protein